VHFTDCISGLSSLQGACWTPSNTSRMADSTRAALSSASYADNHNMNSKSTNRNVNNSNKNNNSYDGNDDDDDDYNKITELAYTR
jgi:hypothetical protein